MHSPQSTVIFVHSTAHWEAIQRQRAQLLGVKPEPEPIKKEKKAAPLSVKSRRPNVGSETSRRRKRWVNNNFSNHPQAVLYAEDLRPPGYIYKHHDTLILEQDITIKSRPQHIAPTILNRHIRHDLKKTHISQGLVSKYESMLMEFIDAWLDNLEELENACLQIASNNQFERYVVHTLSQYYGLESFSETNDQNIRTTFIFHPAYMDYITKGSKEINYLDAADWIMPQNSFFDYLFNK
ncbi:hypothetical protein MFLAVUS_002338 [Mucor flavus]|uniref:R3H domain-containing protein n=1 Tax=Mucor flavus TaxID=439312 RepID=A0ABP9YPZ9_9FUNG